MIVSRTRMITVPKIQIDGIGNINYAQGFEYEGEIGSRIIDIAGRYSSLQDTITLVDQVTLFQAYLKLEMGEMELPEEVCKVLYRLFKETGKGNVTNDACDYMHGDKGMKKIHESDRRVLWRVGIEDFDDDPENVQAIGGEEFPILIPKDGYVIWTNDGPYRPDTGTPYEIARKTRSNFSSGDEGDGIMAVDRYSSKHGGPLSVYAAASPLVSALNFGRFPAIRSRT
jgi:hypothetical protein